MIVYHDVLGKLYDAGYTTTRIRREKILSESTLTKLRHNVPVHLDALDIICNLTGLDISDLVSHVKK